jgi:hypothetical protein
MKDAQGHGSNARGFSMLDVNGKGIMPSRPFREGTAHQVALAEDHGIATDHLVNKQGHTWGSPAALADFKARYSPAGFKSGQREINRLRRQGK